MSGEIIFGGDTRIFGRLAPSVNLSECVFSLDPIDTLDKSSTAASDAALVASNVAVDYQTLTTYSFDPLVHSFETTELSFALAGAATPVTMTGVLQKTGDVVTFAWTPMNFTSAGANLYTNTDVLGSVKTTGLATSFSYMVDEVVEDGRMLINKVAPYILISGELGHLLESGEIVMHGGAVSWTPYISP